MEIEAHLALVFPVFNALATIPGALPDSSTNTITWSPFQLSTAVFGSNWL